MAKTVKFIALLGFVATVAACSSGVADDEVVLYPVTPEAPTGGKFD